MTTTEQATPTNVSLAGEVAREVQLESIALRKAALAAGDGDLAHLDLSALQPQIQQAARVSRELNHVVVSLSFTFDLKTAGDAPTVVLHLDAEYALRYRVPAESAYRALALKYFAEVNGTLNAWPYWRELVNTVASRVGLGAVIVPVFRAQLKAVDDAEAKKGE